jgi:hypothetical protein
MSLAFRVIPLRRFAIGSAGFLVMAVTACGGNSPSAPTAGDLLSEQVETASHVYHFAQGDQIDVQWQEAYHLWATAALGVAPSRRIQYYKYRSRSHMGQIVGVSTTNAYADPVAYAIHTIWPTDNHEVVHLYSSAWGSPVALFSEGFAVAHHVNPVSGDFVPKWSGTPIHDLAGQFRRQGRLLRLGQIAHTSGFRQFDDGVTYPEAGSFVRYLIDARGLDAMKSLFSRLVAGDSADRVRQQVQAVYGVTLDSLEADWLTFLDGR